MDWSKVRALITKDFLELVRNKMYFWPMLILPVIFVIVMPAFFLSIPYFASPDDLVKDQETMELINKIPASFVSPDFTLEQKLVYIIVMYFFAPFFLLIPVMVSSITAANSFAGEKERKTLEGLLYTPLTDQEIVLGKVLVSWGLAVGIAFVSFVGYAILVNSMGWPTFGRIIFPNVTWLLMMFWLIPAVSFLSLAIIVLVSQRSATSQEAQQMSVFLILPIIMVVISQVTGLVYLSPMIVLGAGLFLWIVDGAIFLWMRESFNRERMITKLV